MIGCPVCNGYQNLYLSCPSCAHVMEDQGKISDFYDDYSPYMEIDLMKMEDGIPDNFEDEKCLHLYQCPNCGHEHNELIQDK